MDNIQKLKKWVEESNNIVFFGGAGVSTESGIPDFRGEAGIYQTISEYGINPETILSHTFLKITKRYFLITAKSILFFLMQSQMLLITVYLSLKNRENLKQLLLRI